MRKKKAEKMEPDTQALRHFETLFQKDKVEAEERLAIIRARIRTLERAIAAREGTWIKGS